MLFDKKTTKTAKSHPATDVKSEEPKVVVAPQTTTEHKTGKRVYRVLIKPIITEKATSLGAINKYIFEIALSMNKIEVQKGIKELYGFTPIKVHVLKVKGKNVRYGKSLGRTKDWKKAIVTLKPNDKINFVAH